MTTKTWGEGGLPVLLLLTSVELLVFLEVSIVNVALPSIGVSLAMTQVGLAWVVNAYQLTLGGLQLVSGRAVDLVGGRRMFQTGLAVFTLASLLAALAGDPATLVAARALQGVGAAVLIPAELALLAAVFTEPAVFRRAMGVWSAMAAVGAGAGVVLGGVLTQALGWPSVFWVNVPIGLAALLLGGRLLPADPPRGRRGGPLPVDVAGAVAITSALAALVYAAAEFGAHGPTPAAAGSLGLLAAGAAVFAVRQRTARAPVLPRGIWRGVGVRSGAVANLLVGAVHVPGFVLLTLFFQQVLGYSAVWSGLALVPVVAVNLVAARTAVPWAMGRWGPRAVLACGMGLMAVGLGASALALRPGADYASQILPALVVFAAGLPAVFVSATAPALRAAAGDRAGTVSGLLNSAQRVGAALGLAALLAVVESLTGAGAGPEAVSGGLRPAMAGAAVLALVGVAAALASRSRGTGEAQAEPAPDGRTA